MLIDSNGEPIIVGNLYMLSHSINIFSDDEYYSWGEIALVLSVSKTPSEEASYDATNSEGFCYKTTFIINGKEIMYKFFDGGLESL